MDADVLENSEVAEFDPEVIRQAKDMGWVEKNEWRGNPDHWRSPDEYVRRGHEVLPIVRSQLERAKAEQQKREEEFERARREYEERNRRQDEDARALQERLEAQKREFDDRTERNERMARIALERQRKTFLEQIDAAKYNAVSAGDRQTYDGLMERERQFYAEVRTEDEQYQPQPLRREPEQTSRKEEPPQVAPLVLRDQRVRDEWLEKNPWFNRSNELNIEAQKVHVELWEKFPGIDLAENLSRVTSEMKKRHPEKFGLEPKKETPPPERDKSSATHSFVEGTSSGPASGTNSNSSRRKGWNDIHVDDRTLAERSYIKTGFYGKDANKAREEYAKDYWEINGG
jgi:hypothetical protein